jgi:hypothetical protein
MPHEHVTDCARGPSLLALKKKQAHSFRSGPAFLLLLSLSYLVSTTLVCTMLSPTWIDRM